MTKPRHKIIWIESLGFFSALSGGLKSIFNDLEIRFDEHRASRAALGVVSLFNRFSSRTVFSHANLSLNQLDATGCALEYRRLDLLAQILEAYCQQQLVEASLDFKLMMKSYLASYLDLGSRVIFIIMVEHQALTMKDSDHEIVITGGPGIHIIVDFLKVNFAKIRQGSVLWAYLSKLGFVFLLTGKLLFNRTFLFLRGENRKEGKEVLIEYAPENGVWRIFFDHLSGLWKNRGYRMALYWDRADTPWSNAIRESIKQRGFDAVNVKGYSNMSLGYKEAWDALIYAFKETGPRKPLWRFLLNYHFKVLFFTFSRLYRERQVKILIQHQEIRWVQEAQAQAIKAEGGIMMGLHWSSYIYFNLPSHLNPQHVFFVWGKVHGDFLANKGNTCKYILPSGVWVGESAVSVRPKVLLSKDIDFRLGIFDDDCAYNVYTSAESVIQFYQGVIELLEDNPRWGGIIKSKHFELDHLASFPGGKDIRLRLGKLIEAERVTWLNFIEYTPVAVARMVDFSLCLGISSAGIICASHGFRAIYWDNVGWKRYPFYNELLNKIIFSSMAGLKKATVEFNKGDRIIGDFSTWVKQYNFFEDQNGLTRITDFMDILMDCLEESKTRDAALADAVSKYCKKKGIEMNALSLEEKVLVRT